MKKTRKQIRRDRLWKHWLSFLSKKCYGPDFKEIKDYNPELWRNAFEKFQTYGKSKLTKEEIYNIEPLIAAQKSKEITLTSLAEESMWYWSTGGGWIYPWLGSLQKPIERLFRVAILRTMRKIRDSGSLEFFLSHPGISEETKTRYLKRYLDKNSRMPLRK